MLDIVYVYVLVLCVTGDSIQSLDSKKMFRVLCTPLLAHTKGRKAFGALLKALYGLCSRLWILRADRLTNIAQLETCKNTEEWSLYSINILQSLM